MNEKKSTYSRDLYKEKKESVTLILRADIARAFRRCIWLGINETGRSPYEVQNELIEEFLKRHGC